MVPNPHQVHGCSISRDPGPHRPGHLPEPLIAYKALLDGQTPADRHRSRLTLHPPFFEQVAASLCSGSYFRLPSPGPHERLSNEPAAMKRLQRTCSALVSVDILSGIDLIRHRQKHRRRLAGPLLLFLCLLLSPHPWKHEILKAQGITAGAPVLAEAETQYAKGNAQAAISILEQN